MRRVGRRLPHRLISESAAERGSGTLLMMAVLLVVLAISLTATVGCAYVLLAHRARSAADLAALSGASALSRGEDACTAARRVAAANDASLGDCQVSGDQLDFVVQVGVAMVVPHPPPGLPRQMTTRAAAGRLRP